MKYKEGFSTQLVEHFLNHGGKGDVLDPFSGIGTTALTASRLRRKATGIEIMPVGNLVARSIAVIANGVDSKQIIDASSELIEYIAKGSPDSGYAFPHVRITKGAFSPKTEEDIAKAREFVSCISDENLKLVLTAACTMVLERISYTSKDGQYLRWDPRSGRTKSTRLNKGKIPPLAPILEGILGEITRDLPTIKRRYCGPEARFIDGSCLAELKNLPDRSFETVVTSPPYANRYDYTRTYALELAYLGYSEEQFKNLRQALLSATVENRSKRALLKTNYGHSRKIIQLFEMVDENKALSEVLGILEEHSSELSNRNIISLIRHYFTEMAVVISELARVLDRNGQVFMVNDNVRYHGEEVPVDLILSEFAEQLGFTCREIWSLPRGKGNSSQQMGKFGRVEIRKCVYHWVRN